jgi:site-specific DNA-methyltransferase (adenine-specific)
MTKDIKLTNAHIMFGDAMARLKELPDNSIDSIVTDAPYGLSDNKHVASTIEKWIMGERDFIPDGKGFMGKAWDSFVPPPAIWDECLRVLKPGGHLLAFFGSRTQDVGALSIRLAGFEIRDSIAWVYGSGFPKSLDISKAIDKAAGAEREVIGMTKVGMPSGANKVVGHGQGNEPTPITAPATSAAKQYAGWGTALKPAVEPIVVARKPLSEKTVANNVLKLGTGGLNIDASRIGFASDADKKETTTKNQHADFGTKPMTGNNTYGDYSMVQPKNYEPTGRFPANIILDESAAKMLDEQSGVSKSNPNQRKGAGYGTNTNIYGERPNALAYKSDKINFGDSGGASRFFYVAKASKKDRNEGLEGLPEKANAEWPQGGIQEGNPRGASSQNFHPTVKPTKLMEYLVKLVTPIGGTVLDPFTGSGSTGKAALLNGFKFVGCELTEEYLPIIEGRLKFAQDEYDKEQAKIIEEQAETLFDIEEEN